MPPKVNKVPEKVVSKDETIIFYVEIKCNEKVEKITLNSSCRLDIIADYVKRSFVKLIAERIAELTAAGSEDQELLTKLKEYQTTLAAGAVKDIIFQDAQAVNIKCTEDTSKNGKEIFLPLQTYKLGLTKPDETVFLFHN